MVKWSLIWLLLHNVFHHFGILNETFGNWEGGVTHPYTLKQMVSRTVMILTSMAGYDEFMAGAFWFFRGLLVASIVYLIAFRLIDTRAGVKSEWRIAVIICLGAVAFTGAHIYFGFKVTVIPNGAWRETWGLFFFGIGVIYRSATSGLSRRWWVALPCLLLICLAGYLHWSGMNNSGRYRDLLTLPLTGVAGFVAVHYASRIIAARDNILKRLLVFIGENTLYILVLHIISFKAVSALKIAYYGLDWRQIGCHMVVHDHHDDWFWVLYSVAGVALPLIAVTLWRRTSAYIRRKSVLEARPSQELAEQ